MADEQPSLPGLAVVLNFGRTLKAGAEKSHALGDARLAKRRLQNVDYDREEPAVAATLRESDENAFTRAKKRGHDARKVTRDIRQRGGSR